METRASAEAATDLAEHGMGHHDPTPDWLASLLENHAPALVLYARSWCATPEDVVQEALVKLVGQRAPPEEVVGWLYRVVRNAAISAGRAERRRRRRELRVAAPEAWFGDAAGALDAHEASAALEALAAELREVVVARIWGGLTFAEIARLTGTSTSTAQRRYEQGLRELETRLEKPCTTKPRSTTTP
jgi:RNA polymerase sigma-70 factor (ECF subfamily)